MYAGAAAQLCTGSLGDPVVNITFGNGNKPANPLNASATDYTYVNQDCPNDGSYTIQNKTTQCFGDSWHTLTTDHTGDGGGYFMMINASFTPGNFYVHSISGLCANTTYEFAAWMLNLMKPVNSILPNITFSIESREGTVLKSYNTGDLPVTPLPRWEQYGFFFKTPENATDIVLKITNNAPGGIGNDLLLDDITFRPCGPNLVTEVTNQSDTINMCQESVFPVSFAAAISTGYQEPVFYWQQSNDSGRTWIDMPGAGTTTLNLQPTSPGTYLYRMTAAEKQNWNLPTCRVASNIIVINVYPTPPANAGPDKVIINGFDSRLGSEQPQTGIAYAWTPELYLDNAGSAQPRLQPEADMVYTLTVTSPQGCTNTDEVNVKVVEQLFVPNAFTPNGDGQNDVWRIPFLDPQLDATVSVYNRYGQIMYKTKGATVAWNGTFNNQQQPSGTYIYVIQLKEKVFKGSINLIR